MLRGCGLFFICIHVINGGIVNPDEGLKAMQDFLAGDGGAAADTGAAAVPPDTATADGGGSATGTGAGGSTDPDALAALAAAIKRRNEPGFAQVDPALCANCTESLCDIEHQDYCYKYIECIEGSKDQQGRSQYVAISFDCPYPTSWDPKAYACTLPKADSTCVKEPCTDHNLKKYKHPDKNCKIYWECNENRVSVPKCCPDGMGFNERIQNCSRNTPCADICPRLEENVDKCNTDMLMVSHPLKDANCRTYWGCKNMTSYGTCCPEKQKYDVDADGCIDDASCIHNCPAGFSGVDEPCRTSDVEGYRYMGKCRHYMKCINEDGRRRPFPMCCGNGYYFDDEIRGCKRDMRIGQEDACVENCLSGFFECGLKRGNDSKHYQYWSDSTKNMPCPDGVRFSEKTCSCSLFVPNETYLCRADFKLTFENPNSLSNSAARNYIETVTDSLNEDVIRQINRGQFDGKSALKFPMLSHSDLRQINVLISFEDQEFSTVPDRKQILFSNCRTDKYIDDLSPSWEISLMRDGRGDVVQIRATNESLSQTTAANQQYDYTVLSLPYTVGEKYNLLLFWDGATLQAELRKLATWDTNLDSVSPIVDSKPLSGSLYRGVYPAMLSACKVGHSQDLVYGFKGVIDNFEFYQCIRYTPV